MLLFYVLLSCAGCLLYTSPPQTQHMFGIFPAALVAHTGLAGEERLKAFPLQIFQDGDGGNVRLSLIHISAPVYA